MRRETGCCEEHFVKETSRVRRIACHGGEKAHQRALVAPTNASYILWNMTQLAGVSLVILGNAIV